MDRSLPYRGYAVFQFAFGAVLALGSVPLLPSAGGIVLVSMGGVFLLVGVTLVYFANSRKTIVRQLAAQNFVHWTYDADEWRAHIATQRKRIRRLALWGHLGFLAFSLAMGAAVQGEVGNVALAYAISVAVGQVYVFLTARNIAGALDRLGETGECLIGNDGIYVTGQCHRWGDGHIEAKLSDDESRLDFAFSTGANQTYAKLSIPVPKGEAKKARHVTKRWPSD